MISEKRLMPVQALSGMHLRLAAISASKRRETISLYASSAHQAEAHLLASFIELA